jgi:hypothetical protein
VNAGPHCACLNFWAQCSASSDAELDVGGICKISSAVIGIICAVIILVLLGIGVVIFLCLRKGKQENLLTSNIPINYEVIPSRNQAVTNFCSNCGTVLNSGTFCSSCGKRV